MVFSVSDGTSIRSLRRRLVIMGGLSWLKGDDKEFDTQQMIDIKDWSDD